MVNAYLIAYGSVLLLAGRLGDLYGRVALFTAASLACGLAESRLALIAARFVQGLGGALGTAGMIGVYAIVTAAERGWGSASTLGLGALATVLLAAFVALQARIANPILPLRVLRIRTLTGASVVRGFLVTGMFGSWLLGALYLERALGYDPWQIGLAFLPTTVTVGLLSLGATARVMARIGSERTVVAGLASGIVNVSMQLAGALGLAVLGTLAAGRTESLADAGAAPAAALTGGYHLALEAASVCVAVGTVIALLVLRRPREPRVRSELALEV